MSGRGMDFNEAWMAENGRPGANPEKMAAEALAAAQVEGITQDEIEAETGPLVTWIADADANRPDSDLEDIVNSLDEQRPPMLVDPACFDGRRMVLRLTWGEIPSDYVAVPPHLDPSNGECDILAEAKLAMRAKFNTWLAQAKASPGEAGLARMNRYPSGALNWTSSRQRRRHQEPDRA